MKKYQPVIGLEIHVELKTQSKMFCGCPADHFGKKPNTQTCPVCLGLPGALPVPNKKAVEWTILMGKALNCKINSISKFDRKHYFYPDLPKGYQISQYDEPIAVNGYLKLIHPAGVNSQQISPAGCKQFRIHRVHLEEDTGKLIHSGSDTLVDFNRSGVPLVEIVTEPDFDNSDDVKRFLEELQVIVRYLGVSDADMEKGSMRLEPNISIRSLDPSVSASWRIPQDDGDGRLPNYKVEVKNINSFRFVKQAIDYEIERQIEILEKGETPKQETRGFDEKKQVTYSQRTKEYAHDYRYFPEPDIPPLTFSKKYIDSIEIPELPQQKLERYINVYGIRWQEAFALTRDKELAGYFEQIISNLKSQISNLHLKSQNLTQIIANFIINKKILTTLTVQQFVNKAKEIIIPKQINETLLNATIIRIIEVNKKAVEDYKKGKQNALMFLVGQVMRELKSKAEAKIVISKLKERLR